MLACLHFAGPTCYTLFRSYSVNLQSSLNILVLLTLAMFARLLVLDLVQLTLLPSCATIAYHSN